MLEKLEAIYHRWKDVEAELSSPDAMADMKRFAQLNKEYKDLAKIVDQYHIYRNIISNIESNKEILATEKDEEFREMAKGELDELLVSGVEDDACFSRSANTFCLSGRSSVTDSMTRSTCCQGSDARSDPVWTAPWRRLSASWSQDPAMRSRTVSRFLPGRLTM